MAVQLTRSAQQSRMIAALHAEGVASRPELGAAGIGSHAIATQLSAGRWRRTGNAIVLHNGPLTRRQRELVALLNCGPRSMFTAFTAAARWGLRGWERDEIHLLAPAGTRDPRLPGVVVHRVGAWSRADVVPARRLHRLAPALLVAASSFDEVRPACGLLAAAVQQRLTVATSLDEALDAAPRLRHRHALQLAIQDIAQGAQALSEIDFVRLCARNGLPRPRLQSVRVQRDGRRRYLDAEWVLPDGQVVAVEVDGALHLVPARWIADQLRQTSWSSVAPACCGTRRSWCATRSGSWSISCGGSCCRGKRS